MTALSDAREALFRAERRITEVLKTQWPVGSTIQWRRGGSLPMAIQIGVVTQHSGGNRIKVRNGLTDREFWIHDYDIHEGATP